MNCPNCEHEFGYLHLPEVSNEGSAEFSCPSCKELLNANPIIKIKKKMKLSLNIGLVNSAIILIIGYLFYDNSLPDWLGGIFILNAVASLGFTFIFSGKLNSEIKYERVSTATDS